MSEHKQTFDTIIRLYPDSFKTKEDIISADMHTWSEICNSIRLPESFLNDYIDKFNMNDIINHQNISDDFIEKHIDAINLDDIVSKRELSEKIIDKYFNRFNLHSLFECQFISKEMIEKHFDDIDAQDGWYAVSWLGELSSDFLIQHPNVIRWDYLVDLNDIRVADDKFLKYFQDEIKKRKLSKSIISLDTFNDMKKSMTQFEIQYHMKRMIN